jgi:hypothetical protein
VPWYILIAKGKAGLLPGEGRTNIQGGSMHGDVCLPDKSQVAREILTYLGKHPDAQDTVEGILQNWLLDRRDKYTPTIVQEVVKDLVLEGTILEDKTAGSRIVYRLNLAKRNRMNKSSKRVGEQG